MQAARAFTATRPAAASRAAAVAAPQQRCAVVVMAKPTRAQDFSGLSNEELLNKVGALKKEVASTKWLQKTRGIEELKPGENQPQPDPEKAPKGHLNKHLRRQVAQCMTLVRQRQIADGITRKQARRMEKHAAVGAAMAY